jgi:hypothetical protein
LNEEFTNSRRGGGLRTLGGVAIVVIAAAIVTPLVVLESTRSGRLTCPPVFDDVAYMLDAASRARTLEQFGLSAFARELVSWPPHAPVSSAMAGAAIALFGHVNWGPYAMNALVVSAWLGLMVYIFRSRPVWERAALVGLAVFLPMTQMAVREFRPDMLSATLLAWAIVLSLEGPLLRMRTGRLAAVGAFLGAAMVTKSSTSPAAVAILGVCCGVSAAGEYTAPALAWARRTVRAAGVILGAGTLVAAPYFAIASEHVYRYIYDNIFGHRKELWAVAGSLEFHLRYYLDGRGGRFQLGSFAYPALACVLLGALSARALGQRGQAARSLALGAAIVSAFSVAAWNVMKQPFLGLPFQVLLVVAAVMTVRLWAERGPRIRGRLSWAGLVLVGATALAASGFEWPNRWAPPSHPRVRVIAGLYDELCRTITDRAGDGPAMVFVTFIGLVNETNLELAAVRRGAHINCLTRIGAGSLDKVARELAKADMVIAAQSGTGLTNDRFPCAGFYDEAVAFMDASPNHIRIREFEGLVPGRKIIVFARPTPEEQAARLVRR